MHRIQKLKGRIQNLFRRMQRQISVLERQGRRIGVIERISFVNAEH
jgi:hypothetical protein